MRVINNRSSDSSADSSQRESFEDFDSPGDRPGKHRMLGMVARRVVIRRGRLINAQSIADTLYIASILRSLQRVICSFSLHLLYLRDTLVS